MAQRFSQKEAMIACWYLASYSDGGTDKESKFIKERLMKMYNLWSSTDWDRFLEKWNKWIKEDGKEKILNHCKKILDDADYSIRVKALAGMWAVSVDADDKVGWSDNESKYYLAMERALNVKREDVKAEWKKI
jgi:hypothetical protein|tara:strand:+ start:42 stop:440 length:399 start_codon:yes stop_codon:yes gene_type:complete